MRALSCHQFGPEENLKLSNIQTPNVMAGMVLISVQAAAINFPDLLCVQGNYQIKPELPFVAGGEGAGIITKLGEGVDEFSIGDRVLFSGLTGAFGEFNCLPISAVEKIPDTMSFEHAAGITIAYGTSYYALNQRAALTVGETLVVLGAGGGVGLAAVELGKLMGARVIAVASSQEKLSVAQNYGADATINYSEEDLKTQIKKLTNGVGADVIYDPVGGITSEAAFRSIAWGGRHLVIGFANGDIPKIPLNLPLLKGASIVGVFWGAWVLQNQKIHKANMKDLFQFYLDGNIQPHVGGRFLLEDFAMAFKELSERRAIGKIILTP